MRTLSRLLGCAFFFSALAIAQTTPTPGQLAAPSHTTKTPLTPEQARHVHDSAIIIDTHADTPGRFVDENFDLAQDAGSGYLDFSKIKAGNLGAEFFSIWSSPARTKVTRPSARSI